MSQSRNSRISRLELFRQILHSVPANSRDILRNVAKYRNLAEKKITEQGTLIEILEARVHQLEVVPDHVLSSPVSVPPTPAEVLAERQAFREQVINFRQYLSKLDMVTPDWALEYLEARIVEKTSLGCWEGRKKGWRTGEKVKDGRGYVQADLRKTSINGELVGVMVYMHQLAVIARGGLAELRGTFKGVDEDTKQVYEVSHLCHNDFCFNPDHIIIEPREENRSRQSCNGAEIISKGGFTWHPCRHADGSAKRRCVLSTRTFLREEKGFFCPGGKVAEDDEAEV